MVLNRSHIPWFLLTLLLSLAIAVGYYARFHPDWLPFAVTLPAWLKDGGVQRQTIGGTRIGLLYGTIGFLIFVFAVALGGRKKKPTWPLGRVETWVKAHIWMTILTIPLVGYHCGWAWGSPHTTWLLLFYITVMLSGFFGLAMQQFMPKLMKDRLPREIVYDQISSIRQHLVESAQRLKKECTPDNLATVGKSRTAPVVATEYASDDRLAEEAIVAFLDELAIPYLKMGRGTKHKLGTPRDSDSAFRQLKLDVTPKFLPRVEELEAWCTERRQTDLQTTLHRWLHGWLLVHVPVSLILIVITLWHAIVAVRLFIVKP